MLKRKKQAFNLSRITAMRKKQSREKQAEEQKLHIRELNRIYRADGRANETAEETEQRRSEDRLWVSARRNSIPAEETKERHSDDRLRAIARRNNGPFEVKNQRQASDRLRTLNSRAIESNEQRERRIHCNTLGNQNRIGAETFDARRNKLQLERMRQGSLRASNWLYLKDETFHYDPNFDYPNFPLIVIGSMSWKCPFCGAQKSEAETSGLCCSNGNVSLQELPQLPKPLKSLMEGNDPKSKEFLRMIRKYNSSFQNTSFGTSLPMLHSTGFKPTFRIQSQVYHKAGSLMSLPNEEAKFLYIYFLENDDAEAKRRCTLIPRTTKSLIESLQKMLHDSNHYVQKFKTAIEDNPTEDLQIVINADKKLIEGYERAFNTPALNEVAIIIVGNDFEKRDIVLTIRSNELKNICETHISYDALQFRLCFRVVRMDTQLISMKLSEEQQIKLTRWYL
ncbi:hypothetical protein AVEN_37365-1 [Araneus ventricosus]|uniref:Helitron helicase-like domain-containing protein n=1 Tax=Araneus ventricosus TaxID=182803 RepID=A0A4Y2D8D5_ARAVE|nr:hypothetical protein AVEN_37365-1 [Araneus ventricosus]